MKLRVRLKYRDEQKLSLIVGRNPRDYILAKKKKNHFSNFKSWAQFLMFQIRTFNP